jgi:hypothetical protein
LAMQGSGGQASRRFTAETPRFRSPSEQAHAVGAFA